MPRSPAAIFDLAPGMEGAFTDPFAAKPQDIHTAAPCWSWLPQLPQKLVPCPTGTPQFVHIAAPCSTALPQFLQYIVISSFMSAAPLQSGAVGTSLIIPYMQKNVNI